ncbi:hypothetical protein CkaCkLH20_05430 [Colletotrichum karsti]|uniref:Heterokaryon incompatibility domain-containing protein n=1 Tax=Colletotrichum karsti TaxID=1095194 RepID=A0A9P6I711_9PEZI|nr:uncharacterized protein CkaCkLH20_05430 [Colletotrichum karsti]KAF9877164.1 hypothetical protein CkaCkLH20_05430 [Colletotrichum karsti]
MTSPEERPLAPNDPWASLVDRSIREWDAPNRNMFRIARDFLQANTSLDDFLCSPRELPLFWFFQRRETFLSQTTLTKWSRDRLDDYVLLPALNGFVLRSECFFVSHFWLTSNDPDPDGKYLRLLQQELEPQSWSYIWVDWTCIPQHPRTEREQAYFLRGLETMPGIIRNCGFIWFYPPFEPRLWILYEIAEYSLTCDGGIENFDDIKEFLEHIKEMQEVGVRATLSKHGYRCADDLDKECLTSLLEFLCILRRLRLDVEDIRKLMDRMTWSTRTHTVICGTLDGVVELCRFDGTLKLNGECHTFTPFPRWEDSKYFSAINTISHE